MTVWEGNMIDQRHQTQIMIEYLPVVNNTMTAPAVISAPKSRLIDNTIKTTKHIAKTPDFDECMIPNNSCENVHAMLSSISAIYDRVQLHNKLLERHTVGAFATSIRLTTFGSSSPYVLDVDTVTTFDSNDESDTDTDDDVTITEWNHILIDEIDINLDILISSIGVTTA